LENCTSLCPSKGGYKLEKLYLPLPLQRRIQIGNSTLSLCHPKGDKIGKYPLLEGLGYVIIYNSYL